jgi:PAS domain S-box-containing protein
VLLGAATPVYDWRELKRWQISESRLPSGSIIQFREPTLWEQYGWYIVAALVIMAIQAAMIGNLLLERARRRRTAAGLRESEENLRRLVENTAAVPWQADVETWAFTYVGPQAVKLLGYPLEQWYEKDFWVSHLHPDDKDFAIKTCLTNSQRTEDFQFEYRMIAASGQSLWVHDIVNCEHRSGKPVQLRGFMLDISERKRVEELLWESEGRLSLAAKAGNLALWVWDVVSNEVWVSEEGRSFFGWEQSEAINLARFIDTLHPDDREPARQAIHRSLERGDDYSVEYRVLVHDGAVRWIAARGAVEFGTDGKPLRMRGVAIDITERKHSEEALRESEERFRTMANAAPVMIWMSDPDKRCTFFNKGWLDFTGRTLEQELGDGWAEGVHLEDIDRCRDVYASAFDARREFTREYRLHRGDGKYCWVLDHGVPRFDTDGTFLGYIGTALDISEGKRSEETLNKERAFLRQVIDIDPNFIFAKDRDGRFTLVNQAVADAYGTTVEGLIGKTDADFNPNRAEVEYFHHVDLDVIDTLQERFIPEECLTDARGQIRWLQTVKRPIVERDGVANQVLGASTDITRRKEAEAELRQQRDELAHLIRVSTMGELATSLAHELNQPLTAILSNAQAAQRFLAANPADVNEVTEILRDIVEDDNRAGQIIQKMRAMVKKDELKFSTLDLTALISDVVLLVRSDAVLHNVIVSVQLNAGLPPVRGDKVQLQQVMLNLLLNAFDAMKDCPPGERAVLVKTEPDGAKRVKVSVADQGIGLASDRIDKIFQPFYTTKREGLGMGLSISRSIIEAHGGKLWAENNSDRGATFYFTVPVENEGRVTSFEGHGTREG